MWFQCGTACIVITCQVKIHAGVAVVRRSRFYVSMMQTGSTLPRTAWGSPRCACYYLNNRHAITHVTKPPTLLLPFPLMLSSVVYLYLCPFRSLHGKNACVRTGGAHNLQKPATDFGHAGQVASCFRCAVVFALGTVFSCRRIGPPHRVAITIRR